MRAGLRSDAAASSASAHVIGGAGQHRAFFGDKSRFSQTH
jgi:hypothetical protein